jgi:arginyl-tRNA synthetase
MFPDFEREVKDCLREGVREVGENGDIPINPHDKIADISSTVSFKVAKRDKKDPRDVAEEILKHLMAIKERYYLIGRIYAVGPYLNFYASEKFLSETLKKVLSEREEYGSLHYRGTILLEHTSANPDGPIHIGHIRNSIIGDSLGRILRRAGYDVETQYYVNDMGRQVAVVAWGMERFALDQDKKIDHGISKVYAGANKLLGADAFRKEQVDSLLKRFEDGDDVTIKRFDDLVSRCLEGIRSTLDGMNISVDKFVRESQFVFNGDVNSIISSLKDERYAYYEDGALMMDLEEFGFEKDFVVTRGDGTSLYPTRDLAYHAWKSERCDRMIDILGADHKLISSQLKVILKILGYKEPEIVIFEFVSLPEGSMSTRMGKFISVDELLEKTEEQAYLEVDKRRKDLNEEEKRKISRFISVGAVRYDIVKISPDKATTFNWRDALDFEKRGSPYIQYAHTRACSILDKGGSYDEPDLDLLREEQEIELIKKISRFPLAVKEAAKGLKPNIIATYARELAEQFGQFYKDIPVLNAPDGLKNARLALVDAFRIVVKNSLQLLGIHAPRYM